MKTVYALGFFDGVHLGHQALLKACVSMAKSMDAVPCALTFDIHPQAVVNGTAPAMLNTPLDRVRLLEQQGMQQVHTLHFDRDTMSMPGEAFFAYLTEQLGASGLVCGDDFRFGKGGEGTAQMLQTLCAHANIPCTVVQEQTVDGIRVSSTHIRELIAKGQMEDAVRFLGHPHILSGTVVSGRKLGRTIGVPTANVLLPEGVIVPAFGVYAARVQLEDRTYTAVVNIGTRPTVGGHRVTVEPWILDFKQDIYGKTITLQFYSFLRPEEKFVSLEVLKGQIQKDAEKTIEFFAKN